MALRGPVIQAAQVVIRTSRARRRGTGPAVRARAAVTLAPLGVMANMAGAVAVGVMLLTKVITLVLPLEAVVLSTVQGVVVGVNQAVIMLPKVEIGVRMTKKMRILLEVDKV